MNSWPKEEPGQSQDGPLDRAVEPPAESAGDPSPSLGFNSPVEPEAESLSLPAWEPTPSRDPSAAASDPIAPWPSEPPAQPWTSGPQPVEPPLFQLQPPPPPARIPHIGHLLFLLFALMPIGLLATGLLTALAMHDHVFGVSTTQQAMTNIHYILGSEGLFYLFTFLLALAIFPFFWHKGLLAGLQWNSATAARLRYRLFTAAVVCFVLAILNGELLPGPTNTPIEKVFKAPGAPWLLFAFGITFAPFFEEMFFRGFLLPAACTASDWIAEKMSPAFPIALSAKGSPRWPANAVVTSALVLLSMPAAAFLAYYVRHGQFAWQILVPYSVVILCFFLYLATRPSQPREIARPIAANGNPLWSMPSMMIASVFTSLPFAWMHAAQTGYAVGPFLLLVGVSLVLCSVRLVTRSLASSVFVHASYNFLLFSVMLVASSGFRHLNKM